MTSEEKRMFLKGLLIRSWSPAELASFSVRRFYWSAQLLYDPENRCEITAEQLEEIQYAARRKNQLVIVGLCGKHAPFTASEISTWCAEDVIRRMTPPLPYCEEDVDMTPWTPADHWQHPYLLQKRSEL